MDMLRKKKRELRDLAKIGCFKSIKRVGYTTLKNMDRRACDIKCQHVCGPKIVDNYQDFPKAT